MAGPPPEDDPDGPPLPPDHEDVPSTGIEVEAHLHFGMTGSFPLRLGDLFFTPDGLYVAEYGYVTPFIGLTAGKHRRESTALASLYDRFGIDAVLVEADAFVWHDYDNVDRVVAHSGGWFGRPKLTVYPDVGPTHGYRFHDRPAFEEGITEVETIARRYGFGFERVDGLGFSPRESLERFFWRP